MDEPKRRVYSPGDPRLWELHDRVAAVMAQHPDLGYLGFGLEAPSNLEDFVVQVAYSIDYLEDVQLRKGRSSYQLKHGAEQACDTYVSNGALIVAAFIRGLPVKRDANPIVRFRTQNATIGGKT